MANLKVVETTQAEASNQSDSKHESNDVSDHALIELIADKQDRQALAKLYERYRHSLGGFLQRKLREQKLVDEVYNDVMFTIWQKASGFRGDSKVSTWIFGIAYRVCLSHARKESRHTDQVADFELDDLPTKEQETDVSDALKSALTTLSDDHRTVIELAYYMGNSLAEIADIVDCPVNTVKTRLYHARLHLKQYLQDQPENNL